MPRLQIKKREDAPQDSFFIHDYIFLLDGKEINRLTGLELSFGTGEANHAKLSILVDDVEIDAEFLLALQAKLS